MKPGWTFKDERAIKNQKGYFPHPMFPFGEDPYQRAWAQLHGLIALLLALACFGGW